MHPCSYRMSNNQPPGSNLPLFKLDNVGHSPVDLRVQYYIWANDENLRNLVRYLTGAERIDRLLLGETNNGGGVQAGPSSLTGHLQPPPPSLQPVRAPGANAPPPAPNEQGAMQGMLAHTYGYAPGKMFLLSRTCSW